MNTGQDQGQGKELAPTQLDVSPDSALLMRTEVYQDQRATTDGGRVRGRLKVESLGAEGCVAPVNFSGSMAPILSGRQASVPVQGAGASSSSLLALPPGAPDRDQARGDSQNPVEASRVSFNRAVKAGDARPAHAGD